jgi:xylulokinase
MVTYADYLLGQLTGEAVIDYTMASRTMAFELDQLRWSEVVHQAVGLDESIWSRPVPSGTVVGRVRRALADDLGLSPDLLVVSGGHDQTCAALGAGAIGPGVGVVSTGTAEVLATVLAEPLLSEAMFESSYPCYLHVAQGNYFTFSLNHVGGILWRWWRDQFGGPEVAEASAKALDAYALMDERLPPGPSPVMFLPHLHGSGTPTWDLRSKGAVVGLTLATTRHDVAKAILEGLTFELRLNLETLLACGMRVEALVAVGGGAKSSRWLQLKADILNRPLRTLCCREAACLGAALLAGTAVGIYHDLAEAVAQTVRYEREFVPAADRVAAYAGRYGTYTQLHPSLRVVHSRL